jgi:hypothetical protein
MSIEGVPPLVVAMSRAGSAWPASCTSQGGKQLTNSGTRRLMPLWMSSC